MGSTIEVSGCIKYGKWKPLYREERRVSELSMSRSKAGYEFIAANKINTSSSFGGFATAVFGVGGSRNKLMGFKGVNVQYNLIIDGSKHDDIRRTINSNRRKIAEAVPNLTYDAAMLILVAVVKDYDEASKQLKVDIRAEQRVVESLIKGFNANGIAAYASDIEWNIVSPDSFKNNVEEKAVVEIKRDREFFVVEHDVNVALTAAVYTMERRGTAKVMLTGPSGFGKTTAAKALAKKLGKKFIKVDCSALREPDDIVHVAGFRDGKTVFDKTEFIVAIEGGNAVVLLDELNRVPPNVLNTLLPVLDDTRQLTIGTETYKVADGIIFVATANIGQQYVGTFSSDAALLNRFGLSASVGELSAEDETNIVYHHTEMAMDVAAKIVGVLRELRKTLTESTLDFSPRTAEAVAMAMGAGLELHAAFRAVLCAVSLQEEWKEVTDILNVKGYRYSKPKKLLF